MLTTLIKTLSTKITFKELCEEAPDTYTFKFIVPDKIKWEPGAYAHFLNNDLSKGQKMSKSAVREFSIMTHPEEKILGFTTRIRQDASDFKKGLLELKQGEAIRMFKMGNHLKNKNQDKPIVFISMGVGIATFRPFILEYLKDASYNKLITNINIDRSGKYIYEHEFEKNTTGRLKNVYVSNRADFYLSIDHCIKNTDSTYFVVGSKEFNTAVGNYLKDKEVAESDIIFDKH